MNTTKTGTANLLWYMWRSAAMFLCSSYAYFQVPELEFDVDQHHLEDLTTG
jgi:hypothetical protein